MRVGLIISRRPSAIVFSELVCEMATAKGIEIVEPDAHPDVIVAIGGDGTVLDAAQTSLADDLPLLGFNLGTIGFLAEAEPEDLEVTLDRLVRSDYRVEKRLTVKAVLDDGSEATGLNDVVIEKIESQRLVVLHAEVDGEDFLTHRADGLVIATSTGSTAYAFSAGGPLVDPQVPALLFTPVAPHSLFNRTLVLAPSVSFRITVVDDRPVRVSVDGREIGSLSEGQGVTVAAGPRPVQFVRFGEEGFPSRITDKFDLR